MDFATECDELADVIERFMTGTSPGWEWDDYSHKRYKDPFLASVQGKMHSVGVEFPPRSKTEYTSPEGIAVLRGLVEELRFRARQ